jgi:plastocyanin
MSVTANSVSIGDRGKMYVFNAPQYKSIYYLFFIRGNVFELIIMEAPPQSSNDAKVIIDIAKNADRRITSAKQPVSTTSSALIPKPYPTTIPPERAIIVTPVPTNPTGIGNTIAIKNFAFDPSYLIVKTNTVVTWLNQDEAPHTVVSDTGSPVAFFSGSLSNGNFYGLRFTEPGTYPYHCSIHPSMKGIIVVQN